MNQLLVAAAFAPCQVILVSANKLTRYIEPCQLTDDFGGSLEYDHSDWLSKRLVGKNEAANVSLITVLFQNKSFMSEIVTCRCLCWIVWTSPKILQNSCQIWSCGINNHCLLLGMVVIFSSSHNVVFSRVSLTLLRYKSTWMRLKNDIMRASKPSSVFHRFFQV